MDSSGLGCKCGGEISPRSNADGKSAVSECAVLGVDPNLIEQGTDLPFKNFWQWHDWETLLYV